MSQEDIKRAKDILENASITDSPFGETCGEIMEYIDSHKNQDEQQGPPK